MYVFDMSSRKAMLFIFWCVLYGVLARVIKIIICGGGIIKYVEESALGRLFSPL